MTDVGGTPADDWMKVPPPKPGDVLIVARDSDGATYWVACSAKVFAITSWERWPDIAADARARLLAEKYGNDIPDSVSRTPGS